MKRQAPNQRLEHIAHQLRQHAHQTTLAYQHLQQELHRHDGWPTGNSDDKITGGTKTDRVTSHAIARHNITQLTADLTDWIEDIETRTQAGGRLLDTILRTRIPDPEPDPILCRDGSHGKTLSPELTAEIVNCWDHTHKAGLCTRHYTAWYRERKTRGTLE